ncbi:MAG: hypothetical protein JWN41_1753 [Thermoleophilia bacterium]|nr:hypothetical protein [Thermoleophilia bacterium]
MLGLIEANLWHRGNSSLSVYVIEHRAAVYRNFFNLANVETRFEN